MVVHPTASSSWVRSRQTEQWHNIVTTIQSRSGWVIQYTSSTSLNVFACKWSIQEGCCKTNCKALHIMFIGKVLAKESSIFLPSNAVKTLWFGFWGHISQVIVQVGLLILGRVLAGEQQELFQAAGAACHSPPRSDQAPSWSPTKTELFQAAGSVATHLQGLIRLQPKPKLQPSFKLQALLSAQNAQVHKHNCK